MENQEKGKTLLQIFSRILDVLDCNTENIIEIIKRERERMIRFPNPGSDIGQIIRIFKLLYANLSEARYFNLNNMASVMVNENVASSSGFIGAQALEKSYERKDTSRNPLYNQAKMYAEVYRFLGWIISTEDTALNFNFTFLGIQVALSGKSAPELFTQCLLGINYPSHILNVKFTDINKPFATILTFALELDCIICRDEIIIGPMNIPNSYDPNLVSTSIEKINSLRKTKKYSTLKDELQVLSEQEGKSIVTLTNYTRFVISSLVFSGWMEKVKSNVYGSNRDFLKLTNKGIKVANWIKNTISIDGNELKKLEFEKVRKISKIGFLQMLDRADFDVQEELIQIESEEKSHILFSPYQFFNTSEINSIFPEYLNQSSGEIPDFEIAETNAIDYIFKSKKIIQTESVDQTKNNNTKGMLINSLKLHSGNVEKAVESLLGIIRANKQQEFYPLVAELFQIIFGLEARAPQAGVNNERFDVIIPDKNYSIPVEVKSPTEELMISVKAIRQALENKVVLLSRYSDYYPTQEKISSLAVGWSIPNERSDVYKLIEDIYTVFEVNVAVTDIVALLKAAYICILKKEIYKVADFQNVRGVINFEDLQSE